MDILKHEGMKDKFMKAFSLEDAADILQTKEKEIQLGHNIF